MALGDKQNLITEIVGIVLNEKPQKIKFDWFINQHQKEHFKELHELISEIFIDLDGKISSKRIVKLQSDSYFGGRYNLLFEFDERQHFSTARAKSLNKYPYQLKLNYSVQDWIKYCSLYSDKADKDFYHKTSRDFNFQGGRTCQRAYLDCFRDFLPCHNGLNPTLRICEFEVQEIAQIDKDSIDKVAILLDSKLKYI